MNASRGAAAGFALLGAATAWNAGNIGPAAGAIAADLGVSLAAIGVLGGTVFFAGLVIAKLGAAELTRRIGETSALRSCCLAALAGNVLIALSPVYAGAAAGRLLAGISVGLALVLGPVLARGAGGVRLVGIFGAGVTLGTAAALGAGSLMRAAGIDWRWDFALAAAIATLALLGLPRPGAAPSSAGSVLALLRRSATRLPAYRLELLFMTALGIPYVVGVWLIPYLTGEAAFGAAFAGALGVTMYATSAVFRPEGARLEARGAALGLLGGFAPLLAGAGLVLVALSDLGALVAIGVVLAGVGFAIPYAAMYEEAQALFPDARVAAVGLFSVGANVMPAVLMPAVGALIASGDGEIAFLALAGLSLLAGILNLRPAVPAGTRAGAG
jgi:MFS transporter, CP family, cyanate transporter